MRPVKELVGLGTRTPEYEIKAEIDERQAILDGLPLRSQDSEPGDSHQPYTDEQRSIIESEICRLNMEITWCDLGDMAQPIGEPFDLPEEDRGHAPQLYMGQYNHHGDYPIRKDMRREESLSEDSTRVLVERRKVRNFIKNT